ncbi:MAG: M16 family metallopeptidase [Candidatus Kryptoniota bacterium]
MQKRIPKGQARTRPTSIVVNPPDNHGRANVIEPFREKLSNGVTLIGERISSVESLAIGVWINSGSRDEKKDENGITHLIEHMVFKGTEHFTAEEIVETIEGRGGYINAFTTKEASCYYAKVFKEDIEPTIRVLSDLVLYPKFAETDLRNEKKVVLSEMQEIYDDPEDWGMDFVEEKIFAGNSLSMPIIGRATSLKSFTSGDLRRFHSKNFTADRIVISAAGNFERNNLMALAEKYFSPIKLSAAALSRRAPSGRRDAKAHTLIELDENLLRRNYSHKSNGKYVIHRDAGKQAHLLFGGHGPGLNDPDRYAASMVGVILGDGSSSRLYKSVREKDGLAYSIYSYGSAYADSGILGIYACTSVNDAEKADNRIRKTIDDFLKDGPTGEEVARGKAQLKAGIVFSLENLWDRASLFARDELYYGERFNASEMLSSIEKVTGADIAEASRKYLIKDGAASLKILPQERKAGRRTRRRRTPSVHARKDGRQ